MVVPRLQTCGPCGNAAGTFRRGQAGGQGTTTQLVLEEGGLAVDLSPEGTASSAKLIEVFPRAEGNQRIVIPCADQFATRLEEGLRAKGYEVVRLEMYTMADVDELEPKLEEMWGQGAWQAVLLTVPSLVKPYVELLGHRDDVHVVAWDDGHSQGLGRAERVRAGRGQAEGSVRRGVPRS